MCFCYFQKNVLILGIFVRDHNKIITPLEFLDKVTIFSVECFLYLGRNGIF